MRNLATAALFLAIGGLTLIQRDVDGELLVNGWRGLGLSCLASIVAANVFLILGIVENGETK